MNILASGEQLSLKFISGAGYSDSIFVWLRHSTVGVADITVTAVGSVTVFSVVTC